MRMAKKQLETMLNASGINDMYDIDRNWMQKGESRTYFTAVLTEASENPSAVTACTNLNHSATIIGGAAVHVGNVGLPPAPGGGDPLAPKVTETDATLYRMVVSAAVRRQGVAGKLLEAVESYARTNGAKRMFATTANPAAVQCYEKYGYEVVYCFEMLRS